MGVIKREDDLFRFGPADDMQQTLEPASSSDNESVENVRCRLRRRRVPKQKAFARDTSVAEHINRRRCGQKHGRRCEHLRELINMVGSEDSEMDFNIFEPSMSVFAELFNEREKMQAWNEFVNSSEEQQLALLGSGVEKSESTETDDSSDDTETEHSDIDDSWEQVQDMRKAHPSFSASKCFEKIDKNIRMMLKRRHRPMGMLVCVEEEIVNFFKEWPQSVFISKLSNSYERMMLHALCQYLSLISKSFDSGEVRQTQVENPESTFSPPPVLLTQFLEQKPEIS